MANAPAAEYHEEGLNYYLCAPGDTGFNVAKQRIDQSRTVPSLTISISDFS
jgi:hypothetical protein